MSTMESTTSKTTNADERPSLTSKVDSTIDDDITEAAGSNREKTMRRKKRKM